MLRDSPVWIKKWMAKLLGFIEAETKMYKEELKEKWTKVYPWGPDEPQVKEEKI